MELSKRLQAVADMVTAGSVAADVGCDHGYVSIYLISNGICPRVIAMDVNKGPLLRAKEHIEEKQLTDYIEMRLSDGVTALAVGEADTMICAGMGGRLTVRILDQDADVTSHMKEWVLQPQSEISLVRQYIRKRGAVIVDEKMIYEEGKFYPVMKVRTAAWETQLTAGMTALKREAESVTDMTPLYDKFGPVLLKKKDSVLHDYLLEQQTKYEEIQQNLERMAETQSDADGQLEQEGVARPAADRKQSRLEEIKQELSDIRQALAVYE